MPIVNVLDDGTIVSDGRLASLLGEPIRPENITDLQWAEYLRERKKYEKKKKQAKKKAKRKKIFGGALAVGSIVAAPFTGGATLSLVPTAAGLIAGRKGVGYKPELPIPQAFDMRGSQLPRAATPQREAFGLPTALQGGGGTAVVIGLGLVVALALFARK